MKLWLWLKKYWAIVVGVIGAAASVVIGFLLGRRKVTVEVQPTPGPSPVQQDADERNAIEDKRLMDEMKERQKDLSLENDAEIAAQLRDLEKSTPVLIMDPDALNTNLIDVGKKVRGG